MRDSARLLLSLGAASAGLAVALGAFAAHGLKSRLAPEQLATFTTGVTYHFYHSLAICLVALAIAHGGRSLGWAHALPLAGLAFAVGILLFSGSLCALAIGGPRWLGPVTPLGGLAFLVGWTLLAIGAWRS
jgi:uncharacterized membrane protein YgdD (TMEM256/DUF423 family)